jgi:tRNA threonylcarbamoyladenosine biosynthesis protein TsaB
MSKALAIETSGRIGSIATVAGDRVMEEREFPHGLKHAAEIVPIIDALCRRQGWGPRDIETLYVSAGPGSFTGLRIAITLAKTMALATGVRIVAVPSVAVLVRNAPAEADHVAIVLDAKRGQIFTARFERIDNEWVEREPAHLDRVVDVLMRAPRPLYLIGEGLPYHTQFIDAEEAGVIITPAEQWRARAAMVAEVGRDLAREGRFADPITLTPIYIRLPEAEERWQAAMKG